MYICAIIGCPFSADVITPTYSFPSTVHAHILWIVARSLSVLLPDGNSTCTLVAYYDWYRYIDDKYFTNYL